jgi:hypothetical protein
MRNISKVGGFSDAQVDRFMRRPGPAACRGRGSCGTRSRSTPTWRSKLRTPWSRSRAPRWLWATRARRPRSGWPRPAVRVPGRWSARLRTLRRAWLPRRARALRADDIAAVVWSAPTPAEGVADPVGGCVSAPPRRCRRRTLGTVSLTVAMALAPGVEVIASRNRQFCSQNPKFWAVVAPTIVETAYFL